MNMNAKHHKTFTNFLSKHTRGIFKMIILFIINKSTDDRFIMCNQRKNEVLHKIHIHYCVEALL